jgi:hypothetical protein
MSNTVTFNENRYMHVFHEFATFFKRHAHTHINISAVCRRLEFCQSSGGFLPAGAGAAVLSSQLRLEN